MVHLPTEEGWAKAVRGSCRRFAARYRNLNPGDSQNTFELMTGKRAMVAAVLRGVGAPAEASFKFREELFFYLIL